MADNYTITKIVGEAAGTAISLGGVTTLLGEGFSLANKIIGYIDNPAKRAKARREYLDSLQAIREKIKNEQDIEAIDQFLLDLIAAVHDK